MKNGMNISVIGLGKIGLPLAAQFAIKGNKVFGVDTNPGVIDVVSKGKSHFPGEANLDDILTKVVANSSLEPTVDTISAVSKSEIVVVVVPLHVNGVGVPDFVWIDSAVNLIAQGLQKNTLVCFETTLPIGTTRNRFTPMLQKQSGLIAGKDFSVVFSPERVSSGQIFADLKKYPKIVGGIDQLSSDRASEFYSAVLDFDFRQDLSMPNGVWDVGSCESAEFVKLAETTYRDVNIALANQFALFSDKSGINFEEIRLAANSQPFSNLHKPGIAVGGHCIPIYPQMYLWNDPQASIVRTAREINSSMPIKMVSKLESIHGSLRDQKVVIFGACYRGGVKEIAFSGVFPLRDQLLLRGAIPVVHDPLFTRQELLLNNLVPFEFGEFVDAGIIHTDHELYREMSASKLLGIKTMLDGRGILNRDNWKEIALHILGG